jgi:hypothetical protein
MNLELITDSCFIRNYLSRTGERKSKLSRNTHRLEKHLFLRESCLFQSMQFHIEAKKSHPKSCHKEAIHTDTILIDMFPFLLRIILTESIFGKIIYFTETETDTNLQAKQVFSQT